MSKETITKKISFVIFLIICGGLFSACSPVLSSQSGNDNSAKKKAMRWGNAEVVGTIKTNEIAESSGLIASRCQPDVFWTHNDSGDGAFIYALNEKGEKLGTFKVEDAKNRDWEDIGTFKTTGGECFLYIGDIGNNVKTRDQSIIYRVKEPTVTDADKSSDKKKPSKTEDAQKIKIEYPDAPHDAETLFVQPQTGDIYILTKEMVDPSGVYKLSNNYEVRKNNVLEKITAFAVPSIPNGFLTGGDVSADGKRVVVCDYFAAYEIILPEAAANFDEIWKQKPTLIQTGKRKQGEAVTYSPDGETIYLTSENLNSPIIKIEKLKLKEP